MAEPKTRFDLVSPGIGRIAGAVVLLLLGVGVLVLSYFMDNEFLRQMGFTFTLMALLLAGYGAYTVMSGSGARTRPVKCPYCGEINQVLAKVTSFPCFKCDKPVKLRKEA